MNTNTAAREVRSMRRYLANRRRLLCVLVAGCFGTAAANPLGPQVVNGQASFVSQGNLLSITNAPGTIINWQSFSINPGEITRFIQQNQDSAVLNRVAGQDPSQILGALQSNGRVFLINPNGILFGQGAQVDVNGLVASTLNISNEDFLKGRLDFKAGDKAANLKNEGALTTPAGGQVYLIAPNVENSGIITSPKGEVLLAAGHSVQLVDSLNPDLRVVVSAPGNEALNLGQIIAQGGKTGIYGALIKQGGIVNANSAVVGENGKIVLKASRDTLLEAGSRTTATGAGKGGEIQVLGERVGLFGDAKLDASGEAGGGTVLIGGDYQGRNADIPNAKQAVVGKDAEIKADALQAGDGGKVIVWSDEATRFHGGIISARGGQQAGNGGFAEVSGKQYLDFDARVDLDAPRGIAGTLLLDPYDIEVKTAGGSGTLSDFDTFADSPSTGVSVVSAASISGSGTNVVLQATNDILFTDAVNIAAGGVSLMAQAGNNITVNNSITTNGGAVTLRANDSGGPASGSGAVVVNAAIETNGSGAANGGAVTLIGASVGVTAGTGSITTGGGTTGGAVTLTSTGSLDLRGNISTSSATAGDITGTAEGSIEIRGAIAASGGTGAVVDLTSNTGNIKLFDAGGSITASGANGKVKLTATAGSITTDDVDVTVITADNVIFKAANGIHGQVTAGPPVTTDSMLVDASNLDIKNTSSGIVQVSSISAALAVKDLDTDGFSIVQGAASDPVIIGSSGDLSIDNDVSTLTNSYFSLYSQNLLSVLTPLTATNGSVSLSGQTVDLDEPVTSAMVHVAADVFQMSTTGQIVATGTPTATTAGGVSFSSFSLGQTTIGAGAGLQIAPSMLTTTATAGKVSGNHFGFNDNTVHVTTDLSLSGATLSFSGGTLDVDAAVTANMVGITADTLDINASTGKITATAVPSTTTSGGVSFKPYTANASIMIDSAGAGLVIDPAILTTAPQTAGKIAASHFDFSTDPTASVAVNSPLDFSTNASLSLRTGEVDLAANVTAKSISYMTDALTFTLPSAVTKAAGTDGEIQIGPYTSNNKIQIAANDPSDGLWIDSAKLGQFEAHYLGFGSYYHNSVANSGNIVISDPIVGTATSFQNLGLATTGDITQAAKIELPSCGIDCGELSVNGGSVTLTDTSNSIDRLWASVGSISFRNSKTLVADYIKAKTSGGPINVVVDGNFNTENPGFSGIWSYNGDVSITTNGAGNSITIQPPGIDSCYTATTCTSTVTLNAGGSISIPLVKAGSSVSLIAGGDVNDLDGSATNNIVQGGANAISLTYSVAGSINLDAWGATVSGSAGSGSVRTSQPISGGSTSTPTLSDCTSNPTLSGCGTVLPTLATCTSAPTTAGCSAVLPTLSSCTSDPTLVGCTAVLPTLATCTSAPTTTGCSAILPTLSSCTSNPAQTGCTAVLPTLNTCTSAPTTAGCSAVLPTLSSCTSNPTQTGCTAVLPTLATCTSAPTTTGCSAVLPTLSSCTSNPTQTGCTTVLPTLNTCTSAPTTAGCSAVLPTVDACATTPALAGCAVVLPTLASCTSNPAQVGCGAVLPTLDSCTSTPTTAGCTAVLPTLAQCSANPEQAGCAAVVPAASKCVTNPSLPECQAVLPTTGSTASSVVTETVTGTTDTVVTTTVSMQASAMKVQSGSGSASGGGGSSAGTTGQASEQGPDKGEDGKGEKKTTTTAEESGAKKNEPAKKMYCN